MTFNDGRPPAIVLQMGERPLISGLAPLIDERLNFVAQSPGRIRHRQPPFARQPSLGVSNPTKEPAKRVARSAGFAICSPRGMGDPARHRASGFIASELRRTWRPVRRIARE